MTASNFKTGRFSFEEEQFILDNVDKMSPADMAKELNRELKAVMKVMARIAVSDKTEVAAAAAQLKAKPYWSRIEAQFDKTEQELFVQHWHNISGQFKNDSLYTEELQIVEVIKLEILMNRTLVDQYSTRVQIDSLRDQHKKEKDANKKVQLESQLVALQISLTQSFRDYKDLLNEKKGMIKEIKGSREQRVKQLESSKETFGGLMRELILDPRERNRIGRHIEKMRLATQVEWERLSDMHQYENGEYDRPLLNADTINLEDNTPINTGEDEDNKDKKNGTDD